MSNSMNIILCNYQNGVRKYILINKIMFISLFPQLSVGYSIEVSIPITIGTVGLILNNCINEEPE